MSMWPKHCRYGTAALAAGVLGLGTWAHAALPRVTPNDRPAVTGTPLSNVPVRVMPPLDLERIRIEDAAREAQDLPPRYAIPFAVSITPDTDGLWEELPDGRLLWRLRLSAPGAHSINLGFSRYKMPPGGRLLVYSRDGARVLRPFTAQDNTGHGELWTPIVPGDEVVAEVVLPAQERASLTLLLSSVSHDYLGFGRGLRGEGPLSGACNVDVICPEGDGWRDQIRSVAVISTGGSLFCTGFMVNNTAQDLKPYFMTANHCGVTAGNAASLVTYWNYENSTCRPVGSPQSGGAGDGQLTQFETGSFFRSSSAASDFTLVELDSPPNPTFNIYWAGWDRTPHPTQFPSATGIHHPSTDEKRITHSYVATQSGGWPPSVPGDGSHIRAIWDNPATPELDGIGVTEPGSSGSPLFSGNGKHVIGQLHGGPSSCTASDKSDYYGRFSLSWTGGGTDATRLSNWLDPGNTGVLTLDGTNQCTAPGAPVSGTATVPGLNQIQVTWTNGSPAAALFSVYRALGTCAAPGPFTRLTAGLAGSPYLDATVSGGSTYAYEIAGTDPTGVCESAHSACVEATATGACTLAPTFAGLASATNPGAADCTIELAWSPASANCAGPVAYNVYRSTTPGFTPGPSNLLVSGLSGTGHSDTSSLSSGATYYYIVRAVDLSNGQADTNTVERSTAPTGPIATTNLTDNFEGSASGGGFDEPGWTHAPLGGSVDWAWSTAQSQSPTHSWFSDSQPSVSSRVLTTPAFIARADSTLRFFHTYAFEGSLSSCYDAGVLEVSTDGGATWANVPSAAFTAGGYTGTVNSSFSNPLAGRPAWCSGTIGPTTQVTTNLASFAGSTMRLRWREGDDSSVEATGWFVDSVLLSSIDIGGLCNTVPVELLQFDVS